MRHDHDENFNLLDDDVQAAPLPTNQAELDAWLRRRELEAAGRSAGSRCRAATATWKRACRG